MKIALLVVFDEKYRNLADLTLPSIQRYADLYGLTFLSMAPAETDRPTCWGRLPRIREVLQSGFDYCFCVDTDAVFVRFDEDIRDHLTADKDLYICRQNLHVEQQYNHFNAGVTVWRNSPWTLNFLDEIWQRTEFIGDTMQEQAAMLFLLGYRRILGLGDDQPDADRLAHVQELPGNWNSMPKYLAAPNPIIRHFAGFPNAERLDAIKFEIAMIPVLESLPVSLRQQLSQRLNATLEQRARFDHLLADYQSLLRSRTQLARAWCDAVFSKFSGGAPKP